MRKSANMAKNFAKKSNVRRDDEVELLLKDPPFHARV